MPKRELTYEQWLAEGESRFGENMRDWRFVCPVCKHEQGVKDYKDAGAPEGAVGFSCVGRYLPGSREAFVEGPGPCNYAGGGLIGLNPVRITFDDGRTMDAFEFAQPAAVPAGEVTP